VCSCSIERRATAADAVLEAAGQGARIVVLPELTPSGYVFRDVAEARSLSEPPDGPTAEQWLELAVRHDIVIVGVGVELLTEDVNLEHFGHELFALVEQFGCRRVVVNLKEVRMVTSAGLGKMITMHRKMHRHQGTVIFCHLQEAVEDVLTTSRLITYLQVTPDVATALAALPKAP